jgi:hypothetical protein
MSLDRRLRDGLVRAGDHIGTHTEGRLATVVAGARRRVLRRRIALASFLVVFAGGTVLAGPRILDSVLDASDRRPVVPGATGGPSMPQLRPSVAGTYETEHSAAGILKGRWEMVLRTDGVLVLSGPHGFSEPASATYSVRGETFVTDASLGGACPGPDSLGTYRWDLRGEHLSLSLLDDECSLRLSLFTSATWTRQPETSS